MKEIEREQRPREKALRYGIQSLSDEELLCLMIGSGSSRSSVQRISRQVLQATDHLCHLFDLHLTELTSIEGIGDAKALSLMASIELARRSLRVRTYRTTICSAQDVADWLQAEYGSAGQENFIALFLDSKGKMIAHKVLGIGTLNQSVIHPRDIFREAYLCKANSLLFAHNHPSGDPTPSLSDLETTRALIDASRIAGIPIVDHVIVAHSDYFSFKQHHLLEGTSDIDPRQEEDDPANWLPSSLWKTEPVVTQEKTARPMGIVPVVSVDLDARPKINGRLEGVLSAAAASPAVFEEPQLEPACPETPEVIGAESLPQKMRFHGRTAESDAAQDFLPSAGELQDLPAEAALPMEEDDWMEEGFDPDCLIWKSGGPAAEPDLADGPDAFRQRGGMDDQPAFLEEAGDPVPLWPMEGRFYPEGFPAEHAGGPDIFPGGEADV